MFKKIFIAILILGLMPLNALALSDVSSSSDLGEAVDYLVEHDVVSGYADGTFKPNNLVNRAEFLKMTMIGAGQANEGQNCFSDVKAEWFAPYICFAKEQNFINGYADGTFGPAKNVNYAEAAKILVEVFGFGTTNATGAWYEKYTEELELDLDIVPASVKTAAQELTRGEMAQMIYGAMTYEGQTGDDDDDVVAGDDDDDDSSIDNSNVDYDTPLLAQVLPSAHVLYNYYCPDISSNAKKFVVDHASIINYAGTNEMKKLLQSYPEAENIKSLRYRLMQDVPFMNLDGDTNPTGEADLEDLQEFADDNGYDIEDFFLHWDDNTTIEHLDAKVEFDGFRMTTLTDTDGDTHELETERAIAIIWDDFYYVYNWDFIGWKNYLLWRAENELSEDVEGDNFDGYFEDTFNGPISDIFQGITYGGELTEFNGEEPKDISADDDDLDLLQRAQFFLDDNLSEKLFLPNSGNYMGDKALNVMLSGDGTITESVNYPGSTFWKESWDIAKTLVYDGKFYVLGSDWSTNSDVPDDYDSGIYDDSEERMDLQSAAWYWMAYEPGYVAFDYGDACGDYVDTWPELMETDLGEPIGEAYQVASGTLSNRWKWTLWARDYSGDGDGEVTVYYRGNNAWRDGNADSIGLGDNTKASFDVPSGAKLLKADGTWEDAPELIEHMESFGFVIKN